MRNHSLAFLCAASVFSLACSSRDTPHDGEPATTSSLGGMQPGLGPTTPVSPGAPTQGTVTPTTGAPSNQPSTTPSPSVSPTTGNDDTETSLEDTATSDDAAPNDETSTTDDDTTNQSMDTTDTDDEMTSSEPNSSMEPSGEACTDNPDPEQTCQVRKEWGNCEQQWMIDNDYCNRTCGRCDGEPSDPVSPNPVNPTPNEPSPDNPAPVEPGPAPGMGDDNPFPPVQNGQQGWASRYWDCCKPHCSWTSNASNPIAACDSNDGNPSVNDQASNSCTGGGAFTCHSNRPWAHSSTLAYGYAAVSAAGAQCGKCYQLEFTGQGQHQADEPGSQRLRGKTMVVAVTNIGGDVGGGQFDILIPGGGVGMFNACSNQWGISADQLGAQYGGFRNSAQCENSGDPKSCVRQMCEEVFGTRGLTELLEGCLWYVDWFEAANNPKFVYQEVQCPAELR